MKVSVLNQKSEKSTSSSKNQKVGIKKGKVRSWDLDTVVVDITDEYLASFRMEDNRTRNTEFSRSIRVFFLCRPTKSKFESVL